MWLFDGGVLQGALGPGSGNPVAVVGSDEYYGTVADSEFITASELSEVLGFSSGSLVGGPSDWFKYKIDDKVIYTTPSPCRKGVSWNQLSGADLIYGNREIIIGEHRFKVRVLRGWIEDPSTRPEILSADPSWYDPSEWGRTIRRMASIEGGGTAEWGNYAAAELWVASDSSWCMETRSSAPTTAIGRGASHAGATSLIYRAKSDKSYYRLWRPVLELVK